MTWLFIRPVTSLLFRDGRSLDEEANGSSLEWPLPHWFLGALRTRIGTNLGFDWDFARAEVTGRVAQLIGTPDDPRPLRVKGPFYARRTSSACEWLPHRPGDAHAFRRADQRRPGDQGRVWAPLRPVTAGRSAVSPPSGLDEPLLPLDIDWAASERAGAEAGKPLADLPPFLSTDRLDAWLNRAGADLPEIEDDPADLPRPEPIARTQVKLDTTTYAAEEGMLFTARRLEFPAEVGTSTEPREYGFLLEVEGIPADDIAFMEGMWRLGGKGGLARAARLSPPPPRLQTAPPRLGDAVAKSGRFRWTLMTPARFANGWLPDGIGRNAVGKFPDTDLPVKLVAAFVPRPLAHSGWDLQLRGRGSLEGRAGGGPRATRLFVPAGATYFFEASTSDARTIVESRWMKALSGPKGNHPRDRLDAACGMGAGVFGPWEPIR